MDTGFVTVSELNGYIKALFESDDVLSGISVSGEISNIKYHSSGHLYLTLKDENATVNAVMFRSDVMRMNFRPENGMRVIASGRVSVYERGGQYQLYVSYMKPDGIGALYMALEKLKKKLLSEGLFDESKKKAIPAYPKRIGVVTSPTGAVIRDIIRVSGRRFPMSEIVLFPVHVQGEYAVPEICAAIDYFNIEKNVDVLIVGRGGGSLEDLWAFNCEEVVRAVAKSTVPVISAVGHQTDFTLTDLAADKSAATPSMAAELATPDGEELRASVTAREERMKILARRMLDSKRFYLDDRSNALELNSPKNRLLRSLALLDSKSEKLKNLINTKTADARLLLAKGTARLEALSPLAVLTRGFGFVEDSEGKTVSSIENISVGDALKIIMKDGSADARVVSVRKDR
ncbi:MAG: exodeoxyribonuclease VII large subunit [Clostridia bacterium]|nr:exodeoxyribonuclease VII large subunit [Clostridia bacterium]